MNPATRKFTNEFGRQISLLAMAGKPGCNVSSRIEMRGTKSTTENNMTRLELENLRDAINEALAADNATAALSATPTRTVWQATHRHYKGGLYRVIGEAVHTENSAFLTVYDNADGNIFVRPQGMFHGKLEDGRERFTVLVATPPSPPSGAGADRDEKREAWRQKWFGVEPEEETP